MRPASVQQSNLRFPLTALLGSGASVRVLRALADHAQPIGIVPIARECGLTRAGAERVLDMLVTQQMVHSYGSSRTQLFQLNAKHPLAPALEALFRHEQARWTGLHLAIRQLLKNVAEIESAWYFGSVARGTDSPQSDFDIGLIVTDENRVDEVADLFRDRLHPLEEQFYVSFSVLALSRGDVGRLLREGDELWSNIALDAKPLKGRTPQEYADQP